jgi:hypothetical protein
MSGKYYKINCSDQSAVKSKDWNIAELMAYRKGQKSPSVINQR